jgi:hypothetical protein
VRGVFLYITVLSVSNCFNSGFGQTQNVNVHNSWDDVQNFIANYEYRTTNSVVQSTSLQDTTNISDTLQTPAILRNESPQPAKIGYESTKSPLLAVLLSTVLPGAGQIYNESYWKAPLIWAVGGYWVYEWIDLNKLYKDYRDQYSRSLEAIPPSGDRRLQQVRDFYRDERDKFAWYLGALYFANLLDAYIGANLYDFNVSPDLSTSGTTVPRFTASIRIPF